MGQQKKERKLTGPNTLLAVRTTEGLSKSRGASRLQTGPAPWEAGGRGEGKAANSAPKTASPTALQTGLQFLIKDLLRFWMVHICRVGHGEVRHRAQKPDRCGRGLGLGKRRAESVHTRLAPRKLETGIEQGRRCTARGESAPVKLLAA